MAGRRPKPRLLKLITGNPGKRPLRPDEPEPIVGWPTKPPLGRIASAEWDRLARQLESEHRLTTADDSSLTGAALAWEAITKLRRKQRATRDIETYTKLQAGIRMQLEQWRKFVNDLCLSQGTRARAKTIGGKPQSRLRQFLGGHGA
jgi:phage terminase small subunit